jgi:hypothetical protein
MNLWLVGAGAHDPLPIVADANTLARFFELKVLQELNPICVLGVVILPLLLWLPVR